LVNGWREAATNDRDKIARWWKVNPAANIGVATGTASNLLVLDIDPRNGGDASLVQLEQELGHIPPTLTTRTGGGGQHFIFDVKKEISCKPNWLPGIDRKGDGGYVLLPPSNHVRGVYSWANDLDPIKPPAWLLERLGFDDPLRDRRDRSTFTIEDPQSVIRRAQAYVDKVPGAAEGERNDAAFRLAGHLFAFEELADPEIFDLLSSWNARCQPPLEDKELWQCAQSAKTNGKPREPKGESNTNGKAKSKGASKPRQPPGLEAKLVRAADIEPEKTEWLWHNRFPIGSLVDIQGDPGNGKSTLLIDIAARITRGDVLPFEIVLGERVPRGVIVMTAEDSAAKTIVPRLIAAGADLSKVHFLQAVTIVGEEGERVVALPLDVPAIERAIGAVDAALLIIDPYEAHVADGIDTNANTDNRRCLTPVVRMAETTGCVPALVRHLNKKSGQSALHRASGSIAIVAAARAVFAVGPDPDDPDIRVFACSKSNLGPTPESLQYRIEEVEIPTPTGPARTSRVVWLGASGLTANDLLAKPEKDGGKLEEAEFVLTALLTPGPKPTDEIEAACKEAGISNATYWRARRKLKVRASKVGFQEEACWVLSLPD
jgi:hypothetical protein